MTAWPGRAVALDLETTGVRFEDDRIVTACAAIIDGDTIEYQRDWLIAVDIDIPAEATNVHGVTTEHARAHGRPASDVVPEIANAVRYAIMSSLPIVAYNGSFDLTFVDRESRRWMSGLGLADFCGEPIMPVIDPFVCWKAVDRYRKGKRQLTDACNAFGIELGDNAHAADADAIAAYRVAMALGRKFPNLTRMPLARLHETQVGWRKEQCDSLRAHLTAKGKEHDGVPSAWPLHEFEAQAVLL